MPPLLRWQNWVNTFDFFPPSLPQIPTEVTQGCREGTAVPTYSCSCRFPWSLEKQLLGEAPKPACPALPWLMVAQLTLFLMPSAATPWPERGSLLASHPWPPYLRAPRENPALLQGHCPQPTPTLVLPQPNVCLGLKDSPHWPYWLT